MKLSVVGTGYVGLVSGVCLSALGVDVVCIDRDSEKIKMLKSGKPSIYEDGLGEMLQKQIAQNRISFSNNIAEGIKGADLIMLAVGTPPDGLTGMPDLTALFNVADEIKSLVKPGQVVVVKSTVPMGTAAKLQNLLPDNPVASNPEFLREGVAIRDFMNPDRIVIGTRDEAAKAALEKLYSPLTSLGYSIFSTTPESAELIKYAANSMLAAKVAFINEMADLCDCFGANIQDVAKGIGMDPRIGKEFLKPGPGIGGSCFPKDTLALGALARSLGVKSHIVDAVIDSNAAHMSRMVDKITNILGGSVNGCRISFLGLTFKPATDDMRESASLSIIPPLFEAGAVITAYDPEGMNEAKKLMPQINYAPNSHAAIKDAHTIVILTEWDEFKKLTPSDFIGKTVIDLRNIYSKINMENSGIKYFGLGV